MTIEIIHLFIVREKHIFNFAFKFRNLPDNKMSLFEFITLLRTPNTTDIDHSNNKVFQFKSLTIDTYNTYKIDGYNVKQYKKYDFWEFLDRHFVMYSDVLLNELLWFVDMKYTNGKFYHFKTNELYSKFNKGTYNIHNEYRPKIFELSDNM